MSPQERLEFNQVKDTLRKLEMVLDVNFIENMKRRVVIPEIEAQGGITKDSTAGTTGVLQSVNEGGASSYSVAKAYDGTITIEDQDGNDYKIGYYN